MKNVERPRWYVSGFALAILRPLFRFSVSRDAYVLRVVGNRTGPVLKRGPAPGSGRSETRHP